MSNPNDGDQSKARPMLNHNLRNKLAAIVGHCYLLGLEAPAGSESTRRVGQIHDLAFQMSEMIDASQRALEAARVANLERENLHPLLADDKSRYHS
jgi:signal transduction histidine kinase